MVWCGRGCHVRVQCALAEYRESLRTQCVCVRMLLSHHMTSGTVPFKEGTVPCLQPKGGFIREPEGFKTAWREHWNDEISRCQGQTAEISGLQLYLHKGFVQSV